MTTPAVTSPGRLTEAQEQRALSFDPWGDRDADYRILKNAFITTRKPTTCAICFESIAVGSRVRAQTEVSDGDEKVATFRFCPECCRLMACRFDDDDDHGFEALYARYELGRVNAEKGR